MAKAKPNTAKISGILQRFLFTILLSLLRVDKITKP